MTQLLIKLGWMLCALSACTVHVGAVFRREDNAIEGYMDTCPEHFTGLLPYRYDCRRFLNCWKGRGHLQSCAPGTNFNADTLECDRPEKVVCMGNKRTASQQRSQPLQLAPIKQGGAREDRDTTSALEMRCPIDANGPHPHPSDCYKFLNCDHGKGYVMSCGPGTAFNPTMRVCDFPHNVNCGAVGAPNSIGAAPRFEPPAKDNDGRDDVLRCPPYASGLYAHPWNCAKFLNCAYGNLVEEHDCQPGSAFDAVRGSCDERVSCHDRVAPAFDQHGIDSGLIYMNQLPIPTNGPPVLTDIVCPPGVTGLYPYPFDRTKFLNCRDGRTSIQNCQRSFVFSIMKRFCDERHNIPTSDCVAYVVSELKYEYSLAVASCPPGTDGPHLYPYDETKYIYCRNGQLVVQQCSPGATYNTTKSECSASYRDPKSFSDRRDNNARIADSGNRWSNMNRTRPTSATAYSHSYVSREGSIPGQQVIYEEGTLEPERNSVHTARTYSTQLAPFAPMPPRADAYAPSPTLPTTTTPAPTAAHTKVYYAQPVGSQEDSREVFNSKTPAYVRRQPWLPSVTPNTRQNHSREFHQEAPSSSRWTPIAERPAAHDRFGERPDLQQTDPFDRLFNPDFTMPVTHLMPPPPPSGRGQSGHESRQQPLDLGAYPSAGSADQYPSETQPMVANWLPAPNDHHYRPSSHPAAVDSMPPRHGYGDGEALQWQPGNTQPSVADESNLFGGLQPPPPMQQTTTPMPYRPHSPPWRHSSPRPTADNEPESKTRIYQIYPPVSNPREPQPSRPDPHYSPSYASVAHSRADTLDTGAAGRKVPPQHTVPPTYTSSSESAVGNVASRSGVWSDRGDHVNPDLDDRDTFDFGLATTTEYRGATPPPYNRQYYQGNVKGGARRNELVEGDNGGTMDDLPISDAIRMLLRPYFNRSGTIGDDTAAQAESHIMNLMAEPVHEMASRTSATTPRTTSTSTTTTTTPQPVAAQEADVELIFAGEQSSLAHLPTPPNTPDFDLRFGGSAHSGNRGQHSREFHRRHPNLPQPSTFAGDERSLSNPDTVHNHPHHPHHHAHYPHEHSREFHLRHPNMPNPFATREGDHSIVDPIDEELPNPFAEPTTPSTPYGIDLRSSNSNNKPSENSCALRCGGHTGKCLQQSQLCDGIKDCDDRSDENDCDHLGYAIRLAGGETSNVGRIEVRVNGRWGYVCDDKFGLRDADVVCRELGFKQGANEVRGASYYPPDDTNIHYWMDQLECEGNETSLRDCDFSGWGVNNCGPEEVAGVVCKVPLLKCPNDYWLCATSKECIPPAFVCDHTPDCADKSDESAEVCHAPIEYRLEGGRTPTEGRLEVKYRREWGTICDDDFGSKEAQVVCNSMGFYGRATVRKNIYGQGNGPIWLDQVSCFGNESSLDQCHHFNWGEHNCNHTEDVSVECTVGSRPATRLNGVTPKSTVSVEPSTPETPGTPHEDIGLYPRQERQLAFVSNPLRRCGQYKTELADAHSHPEERVVNGTVAKRGRHPWQATIRTRGRGGISSHWCGAVLISKRHLLTAAHCLAGYPKGAYFVRMGDHYANIAESTEVDAFIENWYIHEKFRDQTHMNNDIAVIVLKQPVRFNDYIQPVCLPDKDTPLAENRMCTISGWGSIKSGVSTPSNILRSAQLPLIADSVCKQPHVYGPSMSEGMFCAGSMDESVDACDGDSGGPLVCSDDGGETLYGIISWGQHCGYANKPGVYVRVEKYIDWIYEKINYSLQRT